MSIRNEVEILQRIAALKILPVVTLADAGSAIPLGKTLIDNGLPAIEVTFRTATAADAINELRDAYPSLLIGAGTVLNAEQVQQARRAGADFVVSPGLNANTVLACRQEAMPIIPGVNDASAIEQALELGLTALKFFPAEASGGVRMIEALLAPYPQVKFLPTGGVSPANVRDYLAVPGVFACGGSWMVPTPLLSTGNWDEIGRLVREAVQLVGSSS